MHVAICELCLVRSTSLVNFKTFLEWAVVIQGQQMGYGFDMQGRVGV